MSSRLREPETSNSHTLPRMSRPLLNDNDGRRSIMKIAEHPQRSRPASLYDNLRTGNLSPGGGFLSGGAAMGTVSTGNLSSVSSAPRTRPMDRSPSQTQCLSTTVPQNIAVLDLGGRHAPTRSSLRHSRMIVQTRTGKARKYQPPVMKNHRLATSLVALQVLMGLAVTTLAVWLLLWAPHLRVRDIPYWSGIPLLLCGIFGLTLLCCCRKEYPGMPHGMIIFSIKAFSVFLSVVAGCACFCACVFSLLHLVFLSQMNCEPPHALNSTCVCRSGDINDPNQRTYHYSDLNCAEIGILSVLLIGSCAGNGIGGILATWYVFLHWSSRYSYLYSEVKTNKRPIVISNKLGKKSQRK